MRTTEKQSKNNVGTIGKPVGSFLFFPILFSCVSISKMIAHKFHVVTNKRDIVKTRL